MAGMDGLFDSMLAVAKAAAPLVGVSPAAIELGTRVVEMVDHAVEHFGGYVPADLVAERDRLDAEMRAHVASTADRLDG